MPITKSHPKRVALYVRVSTDEQTTANQEQALRETADNAGWEIVEIYSDHAISGAKSRDQRPALKQLHKDAVARKFDIVLAWSVDRLGRSVQDLVGFLSELHALKIDLALPQQGLDTTTPAGKAMFQMMGVFAEFERTMIQERVKAGLARARSQGKRLGRPRIDRKTERKIAATLNKGGTGIHKIAKQYSVGVGTVQRIKKQCA
jgi:DNA invertase Pin-like site-specific DNA recombinase